MEHDYDEMSGEVPDLSDDDLYFQHVIQDDHELLAMDMMLSNALSQIND
ncbi:MAG: hypothetical protein LBM20_00425 [Rikenellaceae bacterium]|jgi:hypothetical protein|nr:hypothetical protein [Rikenellaceae bacterium]